MGRVDNQAAGPQGDHEPSEHEGLAQRLDRVERLLIRHDELTGQPSQVARRVVTESESRWRERGGRRRRCVAVHHSASADVPSALAPPRCCTAVVGGAARGEPDEDQSVVDLYSAAEPAYDRGAQWRTRGRPLSSSGDSSKVVRVMWPVLCSRKRRRDLAHERHHLLPLVLGVRPRRAGGACQCCG